MPFFQRLPVKQRTMIYCVSKRMEISAAHRLSLSYESKCQSLHGHNWIITVYLFKKDKLNTDGMVFDFTHIKKAIHDQLDHAYINDVVPYNPTAENIARWVVNQFDECYKAEVRESEGNVALAIDETKIVGIENLVM